jgi:hypothetical protein
MTQTLHLDAAEVAASRARHAAERCDCVHTRAAHYAAKGSTMPCPLPDCTCPGYAWAYRLADPP